MQKIRKIQRNSTRKVQKTLFLGKFGQTYAEYDFFSKIGQSLCKKSEKNNDPILRKALYRRTDEQTEIKLWNRAGKKLKV